ncbi:hypothetical protein EYF80_005117 [Liparis tanakae]|uniref:Uncharacterized protein n=1 Tax=Liparis tanakae TaxID=230148 RepID=A0A4Z2J5E0_9TELE|nr:hypothetical protein EYF80_005117 [Liparis tanakae]
MWFTKEMKGFWPRLLLLPELLSVRFLTSTSERYLQKHGRASRIAVEAEGDCGTSLTAVTHIAAAARLHYLSNQTSVLKLNKPDPIRHGMSCHIF